jgi:hypothetical protein
MTVMTVMTVLPNTHISPETAYVVLDYPYGFKLRCQMRYWIEYQPKKGFRLGMQSTNPKRPGTVNKPKFGTYSKFGAALYLDENGHVKCAGLSEYSTAADCEAFVAQFIAGVPAEGQKVTKAWLAAKQTYEAKQQKPMDAFAAAEAHVAFVKTIAAEGEAK